MKKFISTITLQHRGAEKHYYRQEGMDTERILTAFPILQKVSDVVTAGEHISVVALVVGGPEENENYKAFCQELEVLKEKLGFTYTLTCICKENNEKIESIISLFGAILSHVADEDRLYACVTYGTKPMATVTTMALHYAYRNKKNISVESVIYGQKNWGAAQEPACEIFDTTALFYIDCLIDRIAAMKVANPEAALKSLMGLENG